MSAFWGIFIAIAIVATALIVSAEITSKSTNYDTKLSSWIPALLAIILYFIDIILIIGWAIKKLIWG